jgi:HEAT repeat protein
MADTAPSENARFVRDGHGLGHWLRELVCDDMDRRDRAADILGRMHLDIPDDPAELEGFDPVDRMEAFAAEVRRTLAAPGFDAPAYLAELIVFMRESHELWMALTERESRRQDRVLDRLLARLGPEPTPEGLEAIGPRLRRVICAGCDSNSPAVKMQERVLGQSCAAGTVFRALGDELLLVPDLLLEMLRHDRERYKAAAALVRIGPTGVGFAPELLRRLDASGDRYTFDASQALAAVIRDDPALIRAVVDRLGAEGWGVAWGAADTLGYLGPAARQVPGCVAALLAMTDHPDRRVAAIAALGHVTAGTDAAVDRLLALSHDPEMYVRGAALTALGHVGRQPERVVPRLIAAFDDYEEEDPDWTHRSAHERVTDALRAFGPAAAPAVPVLAARVRNPDGDLDRGVVEALGAIGPAAEAALPALRRVAEDLGYTDDQLRDQDDPLAAAIARVAGDGDR